ncbi:MAG: ABC transporter ATP-binding protein [Candidatus Binatia bacterium]
MSGLVVKEISKSFGSNTILHDISFDVTEGEFCVLLGPSGCGKSTLLRLVAGLERPSSGSISLNSRRIDGLAPRERDIAFVFQSYALYPHKNVFENLAFSLRLKHVAKEEISGKVREVARLLEIEGLLDRKPQALSGGQKQRVALGRAIVRQPKLFLFDEPLSNLDASLRTSMRVELAHLHRKLHATILYVTHDQAEAMTLGDKIVVLDRGGIQQSGLPSTIYHKPANTFVAHFVGSPPMNLIEGILGDRGQLKFSNNSIDLSEMFPKSLDLSQGEALTLGVRPENIQLTDPDHSLIHGVVELVEDLGSDRFLHLRSGRTILVARIPRELCIRTGEVAYLTAKPERLHLFYRENRLNE